MVNTKARYPDEARVSIGRIDDTGSEYNATTDISTWSESGFGQPVSSDQLWGNAKVLKREPQEDGEVSFDVVVTNNEWDKIFWNATGSDFTSGSTRQRYRVCILITDATTVEAQASTQGTSGGIAAGSVNSTGSYSVYRVTYADAYCTAYEPEMSADEYLKATVSFTVAATDEDGNGNVRRQILTEKEPSEDLASLGSYTSTNKWD